jgi:hypothetical protein
LGANGTWGIAVLSCYYDDSGTHNDSDVVVWAALFGNKYQWAALDDAWGQALKSTPQNCRPLTHFHMARCDNGSGEFGDGDGYQRWPISDREALAKELRRIINANMLRGFAIGVERKAWDKLITGNRRRILGDAEGWAIRNIIIFGIQWAISRQCECDPDLAMFFDRRRTGEIAAVYKAISDELFLRNLNLITKIPYTPDLSPVGFSEMSRTHPLQAADLFAWEFYQNVRDVVVNKAPDEPQREQMRELISNGKGRFSGAIIQKKQIRVLKDGAGSDEQFA